MPAADVPTAPSAPPQKPSRPTTTVYDDLVAEGFHVAFRKASEHRVAGDIHRLISRLPADEWAKVIDFVLDGARV